MVPEPKIPFIFREQQSEGVVAYVTDPDKKEDGGLLHVVGDKWPPLFPILRARLWGVIHGFGWLSVYKP